MEIAQRFPIFTQELAAHIGWMIEHENAPTSSCLYPPHRFDFDTAEIFTDADNESDRKILVGLINTVLRKNGFKTGVLEDVPVIKDSDRYARFEIKNGNLQLHTKNLRTLYHCFPTLVESARIMSRRISIESESQDRSL